MLTEFTDMFRLGYPLAEFIIRPVLVYLFLVVILRLAGKRELAQADSLDVVVFVILANFLQNAGIGGDTSVTGGWVAAATLLVANYLVVRFLFHRPRLRRLIQGTPTPLIEDGRVLQANLNKELITLDDLTAIVHRQGVPEIAQVERAVLEPGGTVAVFEKHHRQLDRIQDDVHALVQALDRVYERLAKIEQRLGARN